MAKTDNFRKQHKDLLGIVGQITAVLNPAAVKKDPNGVKQLLSTLAGKITVHLAMEDEALYPEILAKGSPQAKQTAQAFMKEMGSIKTVFTGYVGKWSTPDVIGTHAEDFCHETKQLFSALGNRISREDNELYPLYDKT
ncbi:MAG: hemerythrin domain-containing protein [Bdellovibrionota bacterium]